MKKILILTIVILIYLSGNTQCIINRHSTSWYDGWVSCSASQSPNSARGVSHWIMYNLGEPYSLTTSILWNTNDPALLNNGIQGYAVDYSLNGNAWTSLGTFVAEKGSGSPFYEGITGPDFKNTIAQYVLITVLSNYGGICNGFSEIKINLGTTPNGITQKQTHELVAFPNPFVNQVGIRLFGDSKIENLSIEINDMMGRIVFTMNDCAISSGNDIILDDSLGDLLPGIYLLKAKYNNETHTIKLIKQK